MSKTKPKFKPGQVVAYDGNGAFNLYPVQYVEIEEPSLGEYWKVVGRHNTIHESRLRPLNKKELGKA